MNNKQIASELLKTAKDVIAYDEKFKYGLTEEQWDDLERGLRIEWKKALRQLTKQRGPIVVKAEIGHPNRNKEFRVSYDGMSVYQYSKNLDKIPDLNNLQDSKVELEQFSVSGYDASRLKEIRFEWTDVLKKYTGADKKDVHANMIASFVKEIGDEVIKGTRTEFPAIVKFAEGTTKTKVPALAVIIFRSGLDAVLGWNLRDYSQYQYEIKKEMQQDKTVMAAAKKIFKDNMTKLLGDKLRNQSPKNKEKLFQKYAPSTYRDIVNENGNPAMAYDYAIDEKSGDFEIGEGSELLDEERHWATYQNYSVMLWIKPPKSNGLVDLLSDSRFHVEREETDTSGVEI